MRLESIVLENFRNYEMLEIQFHDRVHCFVGKNGAGKTNLIDAIHYLALTRSFIHNSDMLAVREGAGGFQVKGRFAAGSTFHDVTCRYSMGSRKEMTEDGEVYETLGAHIGKYPVVVISPLDGELVMGASESRRGYFDGTISQLDTQYLQHLIAYHKILRQRNALLKDLLQRGLPDPDLIDTYDRELDEHGKAIISSRLAFVERLFPILSSFYTRLHADEQEEINLVYRPDSHGDTLLRTLRESWPRDMAAGRTTRGPHRDDFVFYLNNHELRKRGSQGQQKSFVVALKLAQLDLMHSTKAVAPLLLIDDIFDRLDDERSARLLESIPGYSGVQLFLTDASPERTKRYLGSAGISAQCILIDQGKITEK